MFLFSHKANSLCVCVCVCVCSAPAVINSKILTVTVRPEPQPSEPMVVVELSPLINVSKEGKKGQHPFCHLKGRGETVSLSEDIPCATSKRIMCNANEKESA